MLAPYKIYLIDFFNGGMEMVESRHIEDFRRLDEIDKKATGRRIKCFARQRGFSQPRLAELMKVDPKTISNYYCGVSLPELTHLFRLSRILGKSIEDILVFVGDSEGYQRLDEFHIEYEEENETLADALKRYEKESKLFACFTKGETYIRSFEEAGLCLLLLSKDIQDDVITRMSEHLFFSEASVNSSYMQSQFRYIWRALSDEERDVCAAYFAFLRGERDVEEEIEAFRQILKRYHELLERKRNRNISER